MHPIKLLLFAAHCDDGELWAGGMIARLVDGGEQVVLAIAHHDEVRRREAERGASILGCEVWFRQSSDDMFSWTCRCLDEAQPEILVTHPTTDPHFEHGGLGRTVRKALTKSSKRALYPVRWYSFDTYYSAQSQGLPLLIDISNYFERKCEALRCHRSQRTDGLVEMACAMDKLHGQKIRVQYAEAFFVFPLLGRLPLLRDLP